MIKLYKRNVKLSGLFVLILVPYTSLIFCIQNAKIIMRNTKDSETKLTTKSGNAI